jgi:hypothetical protein
MEISKATLSPPKDVIYPKSKSGNSGIKRPACSTDKYMINMNSSQHNIKLFGRVSNEAEKGPKGRGSNSNQFAVTRVSFDVSNTSWPELRKSPLYQRQGNKPKMGGTITEKEHVLKENEDIGSVSSKSDVVNNVFVLENMSGTALQATRCSEIEGYSSAEERLFNNSSTALELEKGCSKNKYQFHVTTSRKPQVSAGIHNCTPESERCTVCGNSSGVACEKGKLCHNPSVTARTSKLFCDVSGDKMDFAFKYLQKGENLQQQLKDERNIINGNIKISSNQITSSQRKRAWKEEKKRVREEETRKRMLAPKSQRVRLVSQKMLDALFHSDSENMSSSTYQRPAPAMNEKEFPTMEELRKQKMKLKDELSCGVQGEELQGPICEIQMKVKNLGINSDCVNSSCAEREVFVPANSMTVRSKKRKDPIKVDLVNLIKVGIHLAKTTNKLRGP